MQTEESRIIDYLVSCPAGRTTASRKVYQSLLLGANETFFSRGILYRVKGKSLGAGIYEIKAEEVK